LIAGGLVLRLPACRRNFCLLIDRDSWSGRQLTRQFRTSRCPHVRVVAKQVRRADPNLPAALSGLLVVPEGSRVSELEK
jgi:hypothetical protein